MTLKFYKGQNDATKPQNAPDVLQQANVISYDEMFDINPRNKSMVNMVGNNMVIGCEQRVTLTGFSINYAIADNALVVNDIDIES